MSLIRELNQLATLTEGKRRRKKIKKQANSDEMPTVRNYVAKNTQSMSGAGAHEDKNGKKASRNRQKREWKRDSDSY